MECAACKIDKSLDSFAFRKKKESEAQADSAR